MFHIHIGAHKVGSTSLQRFFTMNAALLEELGVVYTDVGRGAFAHHELAKAFTETKQITDRDEQRAGLADLARNSPDATFLISSEIFEYVRKDGIRAIAEAIRPHRAQIIFYVRDFTKQIPSKYAQRTKTGSNLQDFDAFLDIAREMRALGFARIATNWAEHFGWDAIQVRVLERDALVGGDLLRDAWALLGLPSEAFDRCDPASREPVNASPHWVTLEAVREVNRRLLAAPLDLPKDRRTRGIRQTRAKISSKQSMDTHRIARLVDLCEAAVVELGLAERQATYLTRDQWSTLNDLYRRQIEILNRSLTGSPLPLPPTQPPAERPFLPTLSILTEAERAEIGRHVLAAPEMEVLPKPVLAAIAESFGLRMGLGVRLNTFLRRTADRIRMLGRAKPKTARTARKEEIAAARAARRAAPEAGETGRPRQRDRMAGSGGTRPGDRSAVTRTGGERAGRDLADDT